MHTKPSTNELGFTLVEVMIVMAIIAVLAAIAFPSYQEHIRKVRRTDAQAALLENAQFMERLYTETGCYNPGADNNCAPPNNDAGVTLPITESPIDDGAKFYDHTVANLTATTFTLRAAPKGAQAVDGCGTMTFNHVNQKAPAGGDCWRK